MNPTALLALIADLYAQVAALTDENTRLRTPAHTETPDTTPSPASNESSTARTA